MTAKRTSNGRSGLLTMLMMVLVLALLYVTNPDEDQFKTHLKEHYKKEAQKDKELGEIKEILSGPAAWVVGLTTERKNYWFFSSYTVIVLGEEETYLGVINRFIKL
jgi:hypothetical protein